jgi:hypothetical protein
MEGLEGITVQAVQENAVLHSCHDGRLGVKANETTQL